tara:strand:+ start:818 stop:1573 length:756 start_codon:yes stop_codon:yes gene_type:complete
MSSFTLTNTASDIDSAITRVVLADNEPKTGSDNMVTSGGVKAAIETLRTGGISIGSFNPNDVVTGTNVTDFNSTLISNPNAIATIEAINTKILATVFPATGVAARSTPAGARAHWGSPTTNTINSATSCSVSVSGSNINITIPPNKVVRWTFTWSTKACPNGHVRWQVRYNGSVFSDYSSNDSNLMAEAGGFNPHTGNNAIVGKTNENSFTATYNISLPSGVSNCGNGDRVHSYSLVLTDYSTPASIPVFS